MPQTNTNSCDANDKPPEGYVVCPQEATSRGGESITIAPAVPEANVNPDGTAKK